jgi:DNA-binding NtrC family response regulator
VRHCQEADVPASSASPAVSPYRIVVLTTDEGALPGIERSLARVFETTVVTTAAEATEMAESGIDAVILDMEYGGQSTTSGLNSVQFLRTLSSDMVILAVSRSQAPGLRRRVSELGADDFFFAPVDFEELRVILQRTLDQRRAEVEARAHQEQVSKNSFCDLVGGSTQMRLLYESIARVAESNSAVLIRGESGTGKELVARAIVQESRRAEKAFISVNCAALPENLIEAELFGYEKGAFTGAVAAHAGHIENAHGGTLFLDEIATLGMALQSKLLRVLEDHSVQRLGGKTSKKIDFRLLTATNEDLEEMVRTGKFREDLYYRIHVVPIFVPPLREREGDIPLLVNHFLHLYAAENGVPLKTFDSEAMDILEDAPWPGNVRELENLVQRLAVMVPGEVITAKHLPQQILYLSTAKQQSLLIPEEGIDFEDEMVRIERAYLEAALRRTDGRKAAASRLLHIPPQKMKYLCRKHHL